MRSNKELVRAMIDQVWNGGRPDRLPEFWADETRAEAEDLQQMLTGAFPDLRVRIEDMVAEGDRVVVRLTFEGTHHGPFRGIDPTGRTIRFGAIRIYRLTNGKVIETWANQDSLGLIQQLRAPA